MIHPSVLGGSTAETSKSAMLKDRIDLLTERLDQLQTLCQIIEAVTTRLGGSWPEESVSKTAPHPITDSSNYMAELDLLVRRSADIHTHLLRSVNRLRTII